MRKWLARAMIALMVVILGYFVFLSADMTLVPIEKGGNTNEAANTGELARGRDVQYLRVDSDGQEIMSGSSAKFSQLDETNVALADGLRISITEQGTLYEVRADRLEQDDQGNKIMYADGEGLIELTSADGLVIRTPGPLVQTPDNVLQTESQATFAMGEARGRCVGLRFQPETFLEFQADAFFEARGPAQNISIQADAIRFDNLSQTGLVTGGVIQSQVALNQATDLLIADTITLHYRGGQQMEPFHLTNAVLEGDEAEFIWQEGRLASRYFMICFDETGKQVSELYTARNARFDMQTADNYELFGTGGQLVLTVADAKPKLLKSRDAVHIYGEKADDPPVHIQGAAGLETVFAGGQATSTEVFGMPSFRYGDQSGQAGNLRLVHQDGDLMFSERAQLADGSGGVRIQADRILVSDWDTATRQLFAFDFVDVVYGQGEQAITGTGESMEYHDADDFLVLTGDSAQVVQSGHRIAARRIEVTQVDEQTYDLNAKEDVDMALMLARGVATVEAGTVQFIGREEKVTFTDVIRAAMPEMGTLSCGELVAGLKERNGKQILEYLIGSNEVILEGTVLKDGVPEPMSCRADRMTYRAAENAVYFEGEGRDLVFTHPDHNLRGRHLTYNLKDGSIRLGPEKQDTSRPGGNL